jgi:hypothetical protein
MAASNGNGISSWGRANVEWAAGRVAGSFCTPPAKTLDDCSSAPRRASALPDLLV